LGSLEADETIGSITHSCFSGSVGAIHQKAIPVIIHDLRCLACGAVEQDVLVPSNDAFTLCPLCGGERDWVPAKLNTDAWGSPQYVASLDREFASKSDLRKHLKENGLQEAGDRVGGARNESHLGLGKGYSYRGQARRATAAENAGRRPRAG